MSKESSSDGREKSRICTVDLHILITNSRALSLIGSSIGQRTIVQMPGNAQTRCQSLLIVLARMRADTSPSIARSTISASASPSSWLPPSIFHRPVRGQTSGAPHQVMAAALCARSCVQKIQSAAVCRTIVRRTLPYIDQWRLPTCSAHFSIFPAGTHAESATFQGRTLSAHFLHGRTLGPLCPARWMTNHTHFDGQINSELHQAAREDRIDDVRHPRPPAARARGSGDDILSCPRALPCNS